MNRKRLTITAGERFSSAARFTFRVPALLSHGRWSIPCAGFHILVLGLAWLLFPAVHASADQDSKSIEGHLRVKTQVDCLKIQVYLTNATDKEITIVTGAGRVSRTVVPVFFSGSTHLEAASWKGYPTRDMRPVPLTLLPSEETLYDTYIVPHPPGDRIEGTISFRALDKRDHEFTVRLGSQKIQTSTKDGSEAPKVDPD